MCPASSNLLDVTTLTMSGVVLYSQTRATYSYNVLHNYAVVVRTGLQCKFLPQSFALRFSTWLCHLKTRGHRKCTDVCCKYNYL